MPYALWFRCALVVTAVLGLSSETRSVDQSQTPSPIAVGAKVRIVAPTVLKGRATGVVVGVDETSLLVATDDSRLTVARSAITQLEVSTGKRRRALKGMLIGAGVGAVAFAVVGNVGCTSDCDEGRGSLLAFGAGMGAAYGAGIGALIKTDRWGDVPLEHVRVALAPTRGRGAQLSVTLAF